MTNKMSTANQEQIDSTVWVNLHNREREVWEIKQLIAVQLIFSQEEIMKEDMMVPAVETIQKTVYLKKYFIWYLLGKEFHRKLKG